MGFVWRSSVSRKASGSKSSGSAHCGNGKIMVIEKGINTLLVMIWDSSAFEPLRIHKFSMIQG
jgi:hypothetical protein